MLRFVRGGFVVMDRAFWLLIRALGAAGWLRCFVYGVAIAALAGASLPQAAMDTMDARGHHDRGILDMHLQHYPSGMAHLERAVELAPNNLQYHLTLAEAELYVGEPEKALEVLRKAWAIEPSRWTLYLTGLAHSDMHLYEAAIGLFNEAQATGRRGSRWDVESWEAIARRCDMQIAQCYVRLNEPRKAIEHLLRGMATDATRGLTAEPHFWLGVAYWMDGSKELALDQFLAALARDPEDTGSLYNISCYYAVRGQPMQALAYLEQAVAKGFYEPEYFDYDSDMDSIRHLPQFRRLANVVRQRATTMPPTGLRSPRAIRDLVQDLNSRRFSARVH